MSSSDQVYIQNIYLIDEHLASDGASIESKTIGQLGLDHGGPVPSEVGRLESDCPISA